MNITYLDCTKDEYIKDSKDKKYDEYKLEDLVLVRATDIFPKDKIITTPINGNATEYATSSILGEAINELLKEEYHDIDKYLSEEKKYHVIYETLRSTIHFCINGLVSSHSLGIFDNKPYIIIEPLKYHIKDNSLLSLRAEDTYFNDNMYLSNDAFIIIREEEYNKIKNNKEYTNTLEQFKNVFVYSGNNEKKAIKEALEKLGYDSFIINNNGYVDGLSDNTSASVMYEYIYTLRKEYNISSTIHFNSELNIEEANKRNELGKKIDLEHFFYIINNSNLPKELIEVINNLYNEDEIDIENGYNDKYERIIEISYEILKIIGLDKLKELTIEFNNNYLNKLHSKTK